ncbi:hypothetical protein ACE193_25235 [Bernardetia sp. OM2101]|uniref:hypothetical protein n=1 Tax=Bernardetia sp. OM2101 TaxID=3344876 RepID=UPI0035CF2920
MFVSDFSTIPSKEELNKIYESLEKLFSIVPEPNLLNSMFTLLAFTLDTHKRDVLVQKVEEQQKNSQSNYTSFYKTEEAQISGKALISHIIGDFYMQENRNLYKALTYFESSLLDYQKLISINSLKYLPLMAKAYKYLAHTYSRKENYILAVFFYEKCFVLLKQLHKINPKKYDYDFSEHVFYMIGYHRSKMEDTEKAVELSNHFISSYPNEEELPYLTCYQFRTISFLVFLEMQKA